MPVMQIWGGFSLFTDVVPIFFAQLAQILGYRFQRTVLLGPLNVFGQASHLQERRRLVPRGKNKRRRRLPTNTNPPAIGQHLPKLIPYLGKRANPAMLAAILD